MGATALGALIGSFVPVPVLGTLVGAGVGYLVDETADFLLHKDWEAFGDRSVVDCLKDGAAVAADWIVEDLPDIAANVRNATTDFFENAGEAVGNFFEGAGKAVGGFFSGIFG